MLHRYRVALGVTACVLALAACGSTPSATSTATPTASASVSPNGLTPAATKPLDTVTWALPDGEPATLDPLGTVDYSPNTVVSNMCESLLRTNPDLSTSPGLATAVDQPDGTTFVITLREGVTFWNGDPLTADDVVASLKRFADPANGSGWIVSYLNIKSIEATGPRQVTVKLTAPDVLFRASLASGGSFISQKKFLAKAGASYGSPSTGVMCTGPFQFSSWSSGNSIELTRYANYWDPKLKPNTAKLIFKFIDDDTTLLSALKAGEVDGVYGLSPQVLQQAQQSSIGAGYSTPGLQNLQLVVVKQPDNPLNNLKLRQAWRDALDFAGIADGIFRGTAKPAAAVVGPETWGYSRDVFQAAYDSLPVPQKNLEAAKALVAQTGPPSRPIVLATAAGGSSEQVALAAQSAGQAAGIPVTIKKLSPSQFAALFTDAAGRAGVDAVVTQGFSDFPEPAEYYSYFTKGAYYNFFEYDNPTYDAAILKALQTYDDAARAKLVTQAQAIFMTDLPTIPIAFPNVTLFMNSRVSGVPAGWAFMTSPWAAYLGGT